MPEVIFTGPAGRIEGRYHPARQKNAPIGIVLHPHPQFGGTMNHQIVYQLYYAFVHRGFSALRFNFRGVGRSQGGFDHGVGELSDAASALDWAQTVNTEARSCWIAGFSFGAWIGMQLLMRRPEIEGFISIAPPANLYDFSFLAPCPSSGLIIHGDKDAVVPPRDVTDLVEKLKTQKGIVIEQKVVPGANHFFDGKVEPLMTIDRRAISTSGSAQGRPGATARRNFDYCAALTGGNAIVPIFDKSSLREARSMSMPTTLPSASKSATNPSTILALRLPAPLSARCKGCRSLGNNAISLVVLAEIAIEERVVNRVSVFECYNTQESGRISPGTEIFPQKRMRPSV